MAGVEAAYRLEAIQATVRADRAEARFAALSASQLSMNAELAAARAEAARLRSVVVSQAAEVARLRERLRKAETAARELAISVFAASVLSSIEQGSASLRGYALTAASVDIRGALRIGDGASTVAVGGAETVPPEALSTFSFTVAPLAPALGEEPALRAIEALAAAMLRLQRALDRDFPQSASVAAQIALAQTAAVVNPPALRLGTAANRLADLMSALRALSAVLPAAGASVEAVAAAHASLAADPTPASVQAGAAAVDDLAATLDALGQ